MNSVLLSIASLALVLPGSALAGWTVTDAVEHALARGFEARRMDAEVARARAARMSGVGALTPRLSLAGDMRWIDEDLIPSAGGVSFALRQSWSAFLELEQPLFGSGAAIADARAGEATLRAARARRDEARAAIILDVETRFWSVVLARDVLAVEREAQIVLKEAVRLEEARAASGAATPLDVMQAKTAAASRASAVLGAKRDLQIAWEQFLAALGASPDHPPEGLTSPTALAGALIAEREEATPAEALRREAQTARPLLRATEAEAAAARARARARSVSADHWPQLSLVGAYGAQNARQSVALGDAQVGWRAGLRLRWTLWDGRVLGAARIAAAEADLAEVAHDAAAMQAALDVERAVAEGRVAAERLKAATSARALADETLRLARSRAAAGKATAWEVRKTQLAAAHARIEALRAAYEVRLAALAIERARGRLGADLD